MQYHRTKCYRSRWHQLQTVKTLCSIVENMFNMRLKLGSVPWKASCVVPVLKISATDCCHTWWRLTKLVLTHFCPLVRPSLSKFAYQPDIEVSIYLLQRALTILYRYIQRLDFRKVDSSKNLKNELDLTYNTDALNRKVQSCLYLLRKPK